MSTLPLPPKTAGTYIASGEWELVANGGDAVFESEGRIQWNLTISAETAPLESQDGINFKWEEAEGLFRHTMQLAEDEYLWLRGDSQDVVTGIVTNPAGAV